MQPINTKESLSPSGKILVQKISIDWGTSDQQFPKLLSPIVTKVALSSEMKAKN